MADPTNDASHRGPTLPNIQRALSEQYTDAVRDVVHRYAEQRAKLVRAAGRPIPNPKTYARELVDDAYASLCVGIRRWDPTRGPLDARLCWLIKERTWHEIAETKRHEHVSFDLATADPDLDIETALAAASIVETAPIEMVVLTRRVVRALQELGQNLPDVRAILRCWEHGFTEPEDVRALTGLTLPAFKAARERIFRLAKRLPPELREAAHDLLRRVS